MINFSVRLSGPRFEPQVLIGIPNYDISSIISKGLMTRAGSVVDYGAFSIPVESLLDAANLVRIVIDRVGRSSVESIVIELLYEYNGQCNMELNSDEIALIHDLGASLAITCYEESNN